MAIVHVIAVATPHHSVTPMVAPFSVIPIAQTPIRSVTSHMVAVVSVVVPITTSHHSIASMVAPFSIIMIARTTIRSIPIVIIISVVATVHSHIIVTAHMAHPLLLAGSARSHGKVLRKLALLLAG
jgi:hypothetical protein